MSGGLFFAHLVSTGVGPFYDTAAHFFLSIEELLPVLLLAILAGMRGPRAGRWMLLVLPATWLAGSLAGLHAGLPGPTVPVTVASVLLPGLLVALDRPLALQFVVGLGAMVGLGLGFVSGSTITATGMGGSAVLGSVSSAILVTTLCSAAAVALGRTQARIVLRVFGSWTAAFALLALGWALKG